MEWLTELITTMHWGAVAQIIMIDILLLIYPIDFSSIFL